MKNPEKDRNEKWFDNYSAFSTEAQEPVAPEVVSDPLPGTVDWLYTDTAYEIGGEG